MSFKIRMKEWYNQRLFPFKIKLKKWYNQRLFPEVPFLVVHLLTFTLSIIRAIKDAMLNGWFVNTPYPLSLKEISFFISSGIFLLYIFIRKIITWRKKR